VWPFAAKRMAEAKPPTPDPIMFIVLMSLKAYLGNKLKQNSTRIVETLDAEERKSSHYWSRVQWLVHGLLSGQGRTRGCCV
jgi:hypothetical protein